MLTPQGSAANAHRTLDICPKMRASIPTPRTAVDRWANPAARISDRLSVVARPLGP
jgi:hypothetical protein